MADSKIKNVEASLRAAIERSIPIYNKAKREGDPKVDGWAGRIDGLVLGLSAVTGTPAKEILAAYDIEGFPRDEKNP
jgi:hypothetical protein